MMAMSTLYMMVMSSVYVMMLMILSCQHYLSCLYDGHAYMMVLFFFRELDVLRGHVR